MDNQTDASRRWYEQQAQNQVPIDVFWQMKAQLDAQDRELADVKKDIRELLALANRGKGGWVMLTAVGGLLGALITTAGEMFFHGGKA